MNRVEIVPGDIILVNNLKGGWFQKAIRFFGESRWTHTAVGFFPAGGKDMIFEANMAVTTSEASSIIGNPDFDVKVYRWRSTPSTSALWDVYDRFNGHIYGVSQLPWLVWRWLVKRLTKKDLKNGHNWFPNGGEICTEVSYRYIQGNGMQETANYSADCLYPRDIESLMDSAVRDGEAEIVYKQIGPFLVP